MFIDLLISRLSKNIVPVNAAGDVSHLKESLLVVDQIHPNFGRVYAIHQPSAGQQ